MTDTDFEAFLHEFRRVASAFERYPQSLDQIRSRADVYFHVLKKYPLALVTAKADRWIEHETKMPKPADWANQFAPNRSDVSLPTMDASEATEWLRAERLRWADTPCGCVECQQANVNGIERRFVPLFDRDDREIKRMCGDRLVITGEWIHGYALMRWYLAREEFFTKFDGAMKATAMPKADDGMPQPPPRSQPADYTARLLGERE